MRDGVHFANGRVLAPSRHGHEKHDLIAKPRVLHAEEVPHYWVLHPEECLLLVHRWAPEGYVVVQRASAGERLRPEPFEAIEIDVGELSGDVDAPGDPQR